MIKKRSNRKAIIRILEAFLAVLIVMGGILMIVTRGDRVPDIGTDVYERQRGILDIIVKNDILRTDILAKDNVNVDIEIKKRIPGFWNFSTNICELNEICPNPSEVYDREVYSTEKVVATDSTDYAPKKIVFFVWMRD